MSYSKISSILLWVVLGISVVVIAFFYISPRLVEDVDVLDDNYESLSTLGYLPGDEPNGAAAPVEDVLADSTEMVADEAEGEAVEESAEETTEDVAETAEADTAAVETMEFSSEPTPVAQGLTDKEIRAGNYFTGTEWMVLKRTDYALVWAYILFGIALVAALAFPLVRMATNVKALIQFVAVLAGAAVIVLISYFVLASDTALFIEGNDKVNETTATTQRMVGTGLFATYILFGFALLSILYSEVVKFFK